MADGEIKSFKADRGFGFIRHADGEDLFFHVSDCRGFTPETGIRVGFDIVAGRGDRPKAANVVQIGSARGDGPKPSRMETHSKMSTERAVDLLVPAITAKVAATAIDRGDRLNPGLLLDRFPERLHLNKQEHQKEHLERVVRSRNQWSKESYQVLLDRLAPQRGAMLNTARSRIALHLSRAGGLENANCCLHPIHGIAYLPGSGLKGLAHAYACHLFHAKNIADTPGGELGNWRDADEREAFIRAIEDIFGWAPNRERTGGLGSEAVDPDAWRPRYDRATARDDEAHRGAIVFHDAFGEDDEGLPPRLEIDVLTCHYPDYYGAGKAPGDWQSPNPVTFLTIAAGTRFRFRLTKADPWCSDELLTVAKRLLLGGLVWLGTGAKTAAGYGWFDDRWELSPEEQKRQEEERQRRAEQAAAAAARSQHERLAQIHTELGDTQALWVAKEDGSAKGFRLRLSGKDWIWEDGWEFTKKNNPAAKKDQILVASVHPEIDRRLNKNPDQERAADIPPPPGRP